MTSDVVLYVTRLFWWLQGYGNKKLTVYAIREELYAPFKDNRATSATLSPVDMFILLTGETPGMCAGTAVKFYTDV